MLRRSLLLGCTALAGCATTGTTGTTVNLAQAAVDANTIAQTVATVVLELAAITPPIADAATMATLQAAASDLRTEAAALAQAATADQAEPLVTKVENGLNSVLRVASILPLPPPIGTALQVAAILAPAIEGAIGMVATPPAGLALRASAAQSPVALTPDQARTWLQSYIATAAARRP
jgi:hypothetical protein